MFEQIPRIKSLPTQEEQLEAILSMTYHRFTNGHNHIEFKEGILIQDSREAFIRILAERINTGQDYVRKLILGYDAKDKGAQEELSGYIFSPNINFSARDIISCGFAINGCHSYVQVAHELSTEAGLETYKVFLRKVPVDYTAPLFKGSHSILEAVLPDSSEYRDAKWHLNPLFFAGKSKEREDFEKRKKLLIYRGDEDAPREYIIHSRTPSR